MPGEKTEEPTPRQRQRARERGQAAQSKELGQSLGMLVTFCVLYLIIRLWALGFLDMMRDAWADLRPFEIDQKFFQGWILYSIRKIAFFLAPIAGASALAIIASSFIQTKGILSLYPLAPKLDRLNPINGFKRIFSMKGFVELVKAILKIGLVTYIVIAFIKSRMSIIVQGYFADPTALVTVYGRLAFQLGIIIICLFIILSLLDLMYQKWEEEKSLRMSKEDVKEEFKEMEGDPLVKRRIRDRQRRIAMTRMMQEVPKSDVVITNPTHFAVAIRYDEKMAAPEVVAKGKGDIALRIIQIAREFRIPIERNAPLAQSLYRLVDIGQTIPFDLYEALAEILAKIYAQRRKRKVGAAAR